MEGLPTYDLELRAADERIRLKTSVAELRSTLSKALDVRKNAREHLGSVCAVTSILALAFGYAVAGVFASK